MLQLMVPYFLFLLLLRYIGCSYCVNDAIFKWCLDDKSQNALVSERTAEVCKVLIF